MNTLSPSEICCFVIGLRSSTSEVVINEFLDAGGFARKVWKVSSLCYLCVLCVSVVVKFPAKTHHRDTEYAEVSTEKSDFSGKADAG